MSDSATSGTSSCIPDHLVGFQGFTDMIPDKLQPMLCRFAEAIATYNASVPPSYQVHQQVDNATWAWAQQAQRLGQWTSAIGNRFKQAEHQALGGTPFDGSVPFALPNSAIAGALTRGGFRPDLGTKPAEVNWSNPTKLERSWLTDVNDAATATGATDDVASLEVARQKALLKSLDIESASVDAAGKFLTGLSLTTDFVIGGATDYGAARQAGVHQNTAILESVGGGLVDTVAGGVGIGVGQVLGGGPEDPVSDVLSVGLSTLFSSLADLGVKALIGTQKPSPTDELDHAGTLNLQTVDDPTYTEFFNADEEAAGKLEMSNPGKYPFAYYEQVSSGNSNLPLNSPQVKPSDYR